MSQALHAVRRTVTRQGASGNVPQRSCPANRVVHQAMSGHRGPDHAVSAKSAGADR